jgi:hypothetical protein
MAAAGGHPPFDRIPDDLIAPLPDWPGGPWLDGVRRGLTTCDEAFIECGRGVFVRTLLHVRRCRDPNSPHWREGLPTFVCGGGAGSRVVGELVRRADSVGRAHWAPYAGLQQLALPLPTSLAADPSVRPHFGRLSVAFGLSFPGINIGRIEAPREIADLRPDRRVSKWRAKYVDKDQV